jgi:1-pyrroline-5-carboxylate dehydrogenase
MIPSWATYDPYSAGSKGKEIYAVPNLVDGQWSHDSSKQTMSIIDPLDKDKGPIFTICDTQEDEIQPFIDSLRKVPKSGLHNPLKKPERYLQYGDISRKVRQHNSFLLLTKIRQNESSHTFFF